MNLNEKIKDLSLKNIKFEESITKLDSEITKKEDELKGLKSFIFKMQSELQLKDDNIPLDIKKIFTEKEALSSEYIKSKIATQKRNIELDLKNSFIKEDPNIWYWRK